MFLKVTSGQFVKTKVRAYVMPNLAKPLLLGNDFLVPLRISIANHKERLVFDKTLDGEGKRLEVVTKVKIKREFKRVPVRSSGKIVVPAKTSTAIPLRKIAVSRGQDYSFHSNEVSFIPKAFITADQAHLMCTNHTSKNIIVPKGKVLGTVSSVPASNNTMSHWAEASNEINAFFGMSNLKKATAVAVAGLAMASTFHSSPGMTTPII